MLRRVKRVLRIGLFVIGVLLLAWLPLSYHYRLWIFSAWPPELTYTVVVEGHVYAMRWHRWEPLIAVAFGLPKDKPGVSLERIRSDSAATTPRLPAWRPYFKTHTDPLYGFHATELFMPLWPLPLLCLAWPLTSLLRARRRHKRGFPVEPTGGGEVMTTAESSPARAHDT